MVYDAFAKAKTVSLHRSLKRKGVELKLSTLQKSIADISGFSSSNAMFSAQNSDWGNQAFDLSNTPILDYIKEEIKVYSSEDEEHFDVEYSVKDFIDSGLSVPQNVAIELIGTIFDSTNWLLSDLHGKILDKSMAFKYVASLPNAPFRIMIHSASYEDRMFSFFVSFDGTNIVLHNEREVLKNCQESPIEKGRFSSAMDFENRINKVCQIFELLIYPFVKVCNKYEDLMDMDQSNLLDNPSMLSHSDAKKVLNLDSLGNDFYVGNHYNEMHSAEEISDYLKVFYNYPLLIIDAKGNEDEAAESYILSMMGSGYILESTDQHPGSKGSLQFNTIEELPKALEDMR